MDGALLVHGLQHYKAGRTVDAPGDTGIDANLGQRIPERTGDQARWSICRTCGQRIAGRQRCGLGGIARSCALPGVASRRFRPGNTVAVEVHE